jgi:transcription initiation factor TFIID subunit TAF12
LLLDVANDFVENLTEHGAKLAAIRGSQVLEAQDASLYLEQFYNVRIPGFGSEIPDLKRKKDKVLTLHESRLNAVRNAIKKNSTLRMKRRRK